MLFAARNIAACVLIVIKVVGVNDIDAGAGSSFSFCLVVLRF